MFFPFTKNYNDYYFLIKKINNIEDINEYLPNITFEVKKEIQSYIIFNHLTHYLDTFNEIYLTEKEISSILHTHVEYFLDYIEFINILDDKIDFKLNFTDCYINLIDHILDDYSHGNLITDKIDYINKLKLNNFYINEYEVINSEILNENYNFTSRHFVFSKVFDKLF